MEEDQRRQLLPEITIKWIGFLVENEVTQIIYRIIFT